MTSEAARIVAYADLVGGLLDARLDPATERFDAELAAGVAAGTLNEAAARSLRFWQRASLRGLVEHARNVLPPALAALDAAREESKETVQAEQQSWGEATGAATATGAAVDNNANDDEDAAGTDTAGRAADTGPDRSIDLTERHSRLIVAGLTQVTIGEEPAH